MHGLCMRSKPFNLLLSIDLLQKVDEAAKANYSSRSDYIREAIVMRLNNHLTLDEFLKQIKNLSPGSDK
jgi:metal-responsive CopG/Arc/MetJ family transcriptional regulator